MTTSKEVLQGLSGMKVIERTSGEKKIALYETNRLGNKQFNVDGKFYSDKQFDKLFGKIEINDEDPLCWTVVLRQLFDETLLNKDCWILYQPFNITMNIMGLLAEYVKEIGDEKLIGFMCRFSVYTFSDPTHPDYDEEKSNYYISKTLQ